jgi:hypothetical protein
MSQRSASLWSKLLIYENLTIRSSRVVPADLIEEGRQTGATLKHLVIDLGRDALVTHHLDVDLVALGSLQGLGGSIGLSVTYAKKRKRR